MLCCDYFITGDCEGAKVASKAVATAAAEAMKQAAAVTNKSECSVLACGSARGSEEGFLTPPGSAPLNKMHFKLA